jgi:hypothetical protein
MSLLDFACLILVRQARDVKLLLVLIYNIKPPQLTCCFIVTDKSGMQARDVNLFLVLVHRPQPLTSCFRLDSSTHSD